MHNGPSGVHAFSRDGTNFTTATAANPPFSVNITTVAGVMTVHRRERPWILFDSLGVPMAFVSSVYPADANARTYTHVQAFNLTVPLESGEGGYEFEEY